MGFKGQVWVPPANTSFTNLNTNSLLTTSVVGNNNVIFNLNTHSGDNLIGQYISAPATPYCAIMNLECNPGDYNGTGYSNQPTVLFGAGFYDGTKAVTMFMDWASSSNTMGVNIYQWSTTTNISSGVFGQRYASGYPTGNISWFQVRDDGTNIYFYISTDGVTTQPTHWVKLYQQARTSYLSSPSKVGWFSDANGSGTTSPTYYTLNSWQTVGL
jgi:hypothetical protein